MKLRPAYLFAIAFGSLAVLWLATRLYVINRVPKLIVGPDTTVLAGPILPDGTLDFEAAIHAHFSAGVTAENNAVVLLQQAFGPFSTLDPELRSRVSRYLGAPEPPPQGDYFVSLQEYGISKHGSPDILRHQSEQAWSRQKWTRAEFPELAAWIDANEQPVNVVEQASRRSRYYAPLIIGGRQVINRLERHGLSGLSQVVSLLHDRARLRLSAGDFEDAANDLLTSHRLAWLLRQDLMITSQMAANSDDSRTTRTDQMLLAERLSEPFLQRFRAALDSIPFSHRVRDTLDQGERLYQLAVLQEIGRGNIPFNDDQGTKFISYLKFDVNAAMRQMNSHFDALIKIHEIRGFRHQMVEVRKFDSAMRSQVAEADTARNFLAELAWGSRHSRGKSTSSRIVDLLGTIGVQFRSSCDQARVQRSLLSVGLALAIHRARHGNYPNRLDDLVPDFLPSVPLDDYVGRPLRYQVRDNGYLLYSVGPNEIDDISLTPNYIRDDVTFEVAHEAPAAP